MSRGRGTIDRIVNLICIVYNTSMTWNIGELNRGKPLPETIKEKISLKKKKLYKEGKLKLPDNKGRSPWNRGQNLSKQHKERISQAMKGISSWNKNRNWPNETKKKISLAMKGKIPWNKGKKLSEAHKKAISISRRT